MPTGRDSGRTDPMKLRILVGDLHARQAQSHTCRCCKGFSVFTPIFRKQLPWCRQDLRLITDRSAPPVGYESR